MNKVFPDRWVVLEVVMEGGATAQKVFCGNYGGYMSSDTWRSSSPIKMVQEHEDKFEFTTNSGSIYVCYKQSWGMSAYMGQIYQGWEQSGTVKIVKGFSNENK